MNNPGPVSRIQSSEAHACFDRRGELFKAENHSSLNLNSYKQPGNCPDVYWQPNVINQKVFVSWSGGKDCCLSYYLAMLAGLNICCLLSVLDHTGKLGAHSLSPHILDAQAEAIGIPLIKRQVQVSRYDSDYCRVVNHLKNQVDIEGGVFGDVSIGNEEASLHESWVKNICHSTGIQAHLPLWNINREDILKMLIYYGFEVLMIVTDDSKLGKEWLGKKLDLDVLAELKNRFEKSEDGRVGYYHTLVVDGPIFQKRLNFEKVSAVFRRDEWGSNWYLDIEDYSLVSKYQ